MKISSSTISFLLVLWTCTLSVSHVHAQQAGLSEEELKKANNPLANAKALNLQNYYVPSIYDNADMKANTMLFRYAMPFAEGKILTRFTLPFNTVPTGYDANGMRYSSGMGDLNFFATYTFSKPAAKWLLAVGPQVALPTATSNNTGTGKWQLGGALVAFNASSAVFQYGALLTYQASVAGASDRADVSNLQMQPFLLFQLGKGSYLRSTGLWSFNLEANSYNVPFGVGLGQVAKVHKVVFNIFMEPQVTVLHQGAGQPALQLFMGINSQF
jgi:hypothetical protein